MSEPTTTRTWLLEDLLGGADVEDVVGHPVEPGSVEVHTDPYVFGSPATAALLRVRGRRSDGGTWSAFVKVLAHVRHWPMLPFLPPPAQQHFVATFPWREELGLWRPALVSRLPAGLRVPHLRRVVELPDDRVAVWTEEVDVDPSPWDDERFAQAARLLGVLNARMCDREVVEENTLPEDLPLRMWVDHGLQMLGPGPVDDDLWGHPALAEHVDLPSALHAAAVRVEPVMAHLATLRHGMPHGDASPQNLLVDAGSGELVAIDLNFQAPAPLGTDLGQLVVGLVHAGLLAPARLPDVERVVLAAYAAGVAEALAEPGRDVVDDRPDDLARAFAGSMLLRSGFTAVDGSWLDDPARADDVASRVALTRYVLDAAARHA